ncbi:MAG: polysaccharide biosynthesis/export family protein [bacterium]|nr:polysaccharide biosynthesis/export family protein [bacterium]
MHSVGFLIAAIFLFSGCKSYTSNVLLKAENEEVNWKSEYQKTIIDYPIKVGDKIQFTLYTNSGESIIDPSGKLIATSTFGDANTVSIDKPSFEVSVDGMCHFPVIGKQKVFGLKISQLDSLLSAKYESYYNEVYVISKVANKKIIFLGGKGGQVIPFASPTMNLLEAIALYGGIDNNSKGYNIRIIRGDLKDPEIKIVNLRTIADMKNSIISLKPDDIIYIEPVRRPVAESIRDNVFIINIVQVLVTFSILVNTLVSK